MCLSVVPQPTPRTNGAPLAASWCTTRAESTSALPTSTVPATLAGALTPATGAGAYTSGMPPRAQAIVWRRASAECARGGADSA